MSMFSFERISVQKILVGAMHLGSTQMKTCKKVVNLDDPVQVVRIFPRLPGPSSWECFW